MRAMTREALDKKKQAALNRLYQENLGDDTQARRQLLEQANWHLIGAGHYNMVFFFIEPNTDEMPITPDTCVIRMPISSPEDTNYDNPERSVRVWNELCDALYPHVSRATTDTFKGTLYGKFPYLSGTKPTDTEVAEALIQIYQKTERIVVDAPSEDNFVKLQDGTVFCLDMGGAIQRSFESSNRPGSRDSNQLWDRLHDYYQRASNNEDYLSRCETSHGHQKTVVTIKALLYLDRQALPPEVIATHVVQLPIDNYRNARAWAFLYDKKFDATEQNINPFLMPALAFNYGHPQPMSDLVRRFLNEHGTSRVMSAGMFAVPVPPTAPPPSLANPRGPLGFY